MHVWTRKSVSRFDICLVRVLPATREVTAGSIFGDHKSLKTIESACNVQRMKGGLIATSSLWEAVRGKLCKEYRLRQLLAYLEGALTMKFDFETIDAAIRRYG